MADDVISKIKDRLDIVEVVGGYVKLQKSGVNFKAPCPFHNEKTGSFFVSPERQIWHCFGCGLGGDMFGFVKQIENIEFPEALRVLAKKAGVEINRTPEYRQYESAKNRLYEICDIASKFFEKQLHESTTGKKVIDYLRDRGLNDESIKKFRLGYAPESWNALSVFLERRYSAKEIFDAGLTVKKEDGRSGGYYDRFRSRITFPIFDINGQVVGFSGRIFGENKDESSAKYINTPQTIIYDKSRILYGLNYAKMPVRHKNRCLVVEGNMDVIMSHQAGVDFAVASSGTALTEGHLKIIKRYTDNLDLCFDSDNAGTLATDRGVDLALAKGFNVNIIAVSEPDAKGAGKAEIKDPADFVKKYGSQWQAQVDKSVPFLQFYFDNARKIFDTTTALGKKQLTQKLIPFIASLTSAVEKAHWMQEVALVLKLKEDVLYQELASFESKRSQFPSKLSNDHTPGLTALPVSAVTETQDKRLQMLEESLVALCFKKPDLAENLGPDRQFISEESLSLIKNIHKEGTDDSDELIEQLTEKGDSDKNLKAEFAYMKSQEFWQDVGDAEIKREFEQVLATIRRHAINNKLEKLEYEIKSAEKQNDIEQVKNLMMEFSKISKELGN